VGLVVKTSPQVGSRRRCCWIMADFSAIFVEVVFVSSFLNSKDYEVPLKVENHIIEKVENHNSDNLLPSVLKFGRIIVLFLDCH